jgi:hypothetical protein
MSYVSLENVKRILGTHKIYSYRNLLGGGG